MKNIQELTTIAKKIRISILKMLTEAGSGHPGGSLSSVEIVTALYHTILRFDPKKPFWDDRDRFILSKGHAVPLLYAVLAEVGYFSHEELMTLRKLGSRLQGHPVIQTVEDKVPGIEFTSGPLAQGFSGACGMAKSFKIDKKSNNVYVLLGDGECQEGQVWEGAMFASHYKLDNLVAMLDNNNLQIDGYNDEIISLQPLNEKWKSFGFFVQEIDGHDFEQIISALKKAKDHTGSPSMIICHTIKGKGVSFMEDNVDWHGKAPNKEQLDIALKELASGEN